MKIEFFSAECRLCDRTQRLLEKTFPNIQLTIHRQSECIDGSCCELAEKYGVRAVPSLVIDGKVAMVGFPDEQELIEITAILT